MVEGQPEDATPRSLKQEISDLLAATDQRTDASREAQDAQANAIMHLLSERGHYLPGLPPAREIAADARQFAGQLMLAMVTIRVQHMLESAIMTPETKGTRRWLLDYIDGKNHGPVGKPMLWPEQLPGLAAMLRSWGYQPTATTPPFVARAQAPAVLATAAREAAPAAPTLN